MRQVASHRSNGKYPLAFGVAADYRLRILHGVYGAGTRRVLSEAGLAPGMRVADVGCGVGMVTVLLAELVGSEGHVFGIDISDAQLTQARKRVLRQRSNATFVQASATDTGLQSESFDLVYCRFLLVHLPDPEAALQEMRRLFKPGGVLVCEEADVTSAGSEPPSALGAFADLWGRLRPAKGVDYSLGCRLFQIVRAAGFPTPEVAFNQPVLARGENKLLLELSVAEASSSFIGAGLIDAHDLAQILAEMRRASSDESILAVMPRTTQVWARKPDTPRR